MSDWAPTAVRFLVTEFGAIAAVAILWAAAMFYICIKVLVGNTRAVRDVAKSLHAVSTSVQVTERQHTKQIAAVIGALGGKTRGKR